MSNLASCIKNQNASTFFYFLGSIFAKKQTDYVHIRKKAGAEQISS